MRFTGEPLVSVFRSTTRRHLLLIVGVVILFGLVSAVAMSFVRRSQALRRPQNSPQRWIQNLGSVSSLAFFADNRRVVASGDAGRIAIYDATTGKLLRRWRAQAEQVRLARDGSRLLTIKYQSPFYRRTQQRTTSCALWDVTTGRRLRGWSMPAENSFEDVSGDLALVAWRRGRQIEILETATGKRVKTLTVPADFHSSRFVARGKYFLIYGESAPGQLIRVSDWKSMLPLPPLHFAYLTRDEKTVLGLNWKSQVLYFWNLETGVQRTQPCDLPKLRWGYQTDQSLILSGSRPVQSSARHRYDESVVQIRSLDGRVLKRELKDEPAAYGRDGQLFVTGSYRSDGLHSIYDTRDGSLIATLDGAVSPLGEPGRVPSFFPSRRLALSNDGKLCIAGDDGGLIRIWSLPQGTS